MIMKVSDTTSWHIAPMTFSRRVRCHCSSLTTLLWGRWKSLWSSRFSEELATACRDVGAALIGGETAEMPDIYQPGEFDLAGFIVGESIADGLLDGSAIRAWRPSPWLSLERSAHQRLLTSAQNRF